MKIKRTLPFEFIIERLEKATPEVRAMFGCHAIYVGSKIVLILRDRQDSKDDNGVWLATTSEHHSSLKEIFPSMRSIRLFGPGPTGWQVLPASSQDFEESAEKACQLVLKGDPRIGKVPKPKKKKIRDKTQRPRSRRRRSD